MMVRGKKGMKEEFLTEITIWLEFLARLLQHKSTHRPKRNTFNSALNVSYLSAFTKLLAITVVIARRRCDGVSTFITWPVSRRRHWNTKTHVQRKLTSRMSAVAMHTLNERTIAMMLPVVGPSPDRARWRNMKQGDDYEKQSNSINYIHTVDK